jgi:hypothetical protein
LQSAFLLSNQTSFHAQSRLQVGAPRTALFFDARGDSRK